jgi:basic amino acid/polyamine antiporter, APA family
MKMPSSSREDPAGSPARRDAFVTIERRVGAPRLFATAYSTVGSSIYFALGVVAAYALGLTPLVFLVATLLFVLTTLTYFEGMTLHPERGGSAVMARYAFNELLSFIAGWAILLDFLILIAISTLSIGHYLTAFWSGFGDDGLDLAIALVVLLGVARYNFLGRAPRGRRSAALAIIDLALVLLIVVLGLATSFDLGAITDTVHIGTVPRWSDLLFGMTVAVIAYTGIEAAANLAPEVRVKRPALRRTVGAGAVAVAVVFVGMSIVALMALPVRPGVPVVGGQSSGYGTPLGGTYVESPVLGVVMALTSGFAGHLLTYAVAIIATMVLSQAANAGMVGITRTAYTLATHRQIPRGVARLHPRYGTPWIVLVAFTALAAALLIPRDIELLAGMFAYGALIAFALAHLSVCVLRFKEPDRRRPFKVPFNVKIRGRELPLPAVLGALLSIAGWVGTFIYHDQARLLGSIWMAVGLTLYVVYRSREGLSLTRRVEVPAERLTYEPEIKYGNILVPVFGEDLDDDIMSTAGQLASEKDPEGRGAAIEAIYVLVVPMSLPLNAQLPEHKMERARKALERAKQVGEEYEEVDVNTTIVRGRTVGSAILEEARRRKVEAIVIGAEPPSPIKGGGVLGGLAGARPKELGEVTAYVLEKAPVRVLVTAPPDGAAAEPEDAEETEEQDGGGPRIPASQ